MTLHRLVLGAALAGCLSAGVACSHSSRADAQPSDVVSRASQATAPPLVPATAGLASVDSLALDPAHEALPADSMLAGQIRRGLRLFVYTREELPHTVGNQLSCGHCHLNAGQKDRALPLVGVAALFPMYRARSGRLVGLEERIRGCFQRSLNGTPPAYGSDELQALSAYLAWLAHGQPMGAAPPWRGRNTIARGARIPVARLDTARGKTLFAQRCVTCHGADGQGLSLGSVKPGPLWGAGSWNDGAGMARVYTLAGFLRYAMPLSAPGTLSDEEAQQIAAYIDSRPRPVYARKADDFPNGVPDDAVYYARRDVPRSRDGHGRPTP